MISRARTRVSSVKGMSSAVQSSVRALPVHSTHDRVEAGHGGDDVGDQAAFAARRDRLQVGERWVTQVHPERPGAAVRDEMTTELPARRLDGDVDLAGRNAKALG